MYVIRKIFNSDIYYLHQVIMNGDYIIPGWDSNPSKAKVFQTKSEAEELNDSLNARKAATKSKVINYHEIVFWH